MRTVIIVLLSISIITSCSKPSEVKKPTLPAEIVLVNFHKKMVDDLEFYNFMVRGPSDKQLSDSKAKEFSKIRMDVDQAIADLEKAKNMQPQEVSEYIISNFTPEFSKVKERMKDDAVKRAGYYGKVDRSKSHFRNMFTEFQMHIADKSGKIKVPTKVELQKILGKDYKEKITCPVNGREYEILNSGSEFSGNADQPFAQVKFKNGTRMVLYQNREVKIVH